MKRLACALLILAGCGPEPDVEPLPCRNAEPGSAELGAGNLETGFVTVADGSEFSIVLGPQGQHMVTVSVRVRDLEMPSSVADRLRTAVAIRKDGALVGGTVSEVAPVMMQESANFLGLRAIITADEIAPLTTGAAQLETTVTDGCGREISASLNSRLVQ